MLEKTQVKSGKDRQTEFFGEMQKNLHIRGEY